MQVRNPILSFTRLYLVGFLLILLIAGAFLTVLFTQHQGQFKVMGNKIIDPNGRQFIAKGITAVWGEFIGSVNGVGAVNYQNAQRDLDSIKAVGANLVRLFVSAYYANLPPSNSRYLPNYMQKVDNVVTWTTQRGMVIELANSLTDDFPTSLHFVSQLANRYKNNPYVWIEPMNEPNCESGDHTKCSDWSFWHSQHLQYVKAIRNVGNTAPIVVNTVNYSSDLSKINTYGLDDKNIVYGIHSYANRNTTFTPEIQASDDQHWANLATRFPIIVDEVGAYVGGHTYHLAWNQGFLDYVTNWVNKRHGSGAIAYTWYTDEDNSMTGDWHNKISNDVLTLWGNLFYNSYLQKVSSPPHT